MTTRFTPQERLRDLVENRSDADYKTLKELWLQLEPTTNDDMLGQWRGGSFDSTQDIGNFYGKRFNTTEDCEPMLRTADDGSVFAWTKWGAARLREVAYDGKVQATVIYDDRPLMDYFRKIDDRLVLGLGDFKGRPKGFFWLERDR